MKATAGIKPKHLTISDKKELAEKFGIEYKALCAVLKVESAGSGFSKDGRIKIQFEPYHFRKYTNVRIKNGVENQKAEYRAYFQAIEERKHFTHAYIQEQAMLSTSWGLGQVMGFNHKAAGYDTVQEMVSTFNTSEYYQLEGMLNFIKSNKKMYLALINRDWKTFAYFYNGKYHERFNYAPRLKEAYNG